MRLECGRGGRGSGSGSDERRLAYKLLIVQIGRARIGARGAHLVVRRHRRRRHQFIALSSTTTTTIAMMTTVGGVHVGTRATTADG